jgi:large subunit ribosomal protein L31
LKSQVNLSRGEDALPSGKQCVARFHPLRNQLRAIRFRAPFLNMKADIHPEYYDTDIVCACGAVYHTRSTRRDIKIGICAACHPFFTGEQKFVDTAGACRKIRSPLRQHQSRAGREESLDCRRAVRRDERLLHVRLTQPPPLRYGS